MRYVTVSEALAIAEAVTGVPAPTLARASRLDLLESALHAPQASFGDVEFYPDFIVSIATGDLDEASDPSLTLVPRAISPPGGERRGGLTRDREGSAD